MTAAIEDTARTIISRHIALEGAALPILHALQAEFGYLPEETLPLVAEALNISRAEIYGVATFYHDFHLEPRGKHTLALCRAEACQSMGAVALARAGQGAAGRRLWRDHAKRRGDAGADILSGALRLRPLRDGGR